MKLMAIISLAENHESFTKEEIDKLEHITQANVDTNDLYCLVKKSDIEEEMEILQDVVDDEDMSIEEQRHAEAALEVCKAIVEKTKGLPILFDWNAPPEEFLQKSSEGWKVGQTYKIQQSSTSPPASWTEVYLVTRVDDRGVWGYRADTEDWHEYDGADME